MKKWKLHVHSRISITQEFSHHTIMRIIIGHKFFSERSVCLQQQLYITRKKQPGLGLELP